MKLKLRSEDQEFRNPRVFYIDPKAVELDRVLVRLFLHLRCRGTRPTTIVHNRQGWDTVAHHRQRLAIKKEVIGFDAHETIAQAWLESDIFDVVNRGKGADSESIASLRPLHLDAVKIHIASRCRDYNVADHLYSCLEAGGNRAIDGLRLFLDQGRDTGSDGIKAGARLDLETLTLLKLVEGVRPFGASDIEVAPFPPVCVGQARVMCDDILRILAYQDAVPRIVMIEYLRTIFGLHTLLFNLRVARQLPGWIQDKRSNPTCRACPVRPGAERPFADCPYSLRLLVDMGNNHRARVAQLAQDSAAAEYARMEDLIRAIFSVNQLMRYAKSQGISRDNPADAVDQLSCPPADFNGFFSATLQTVLSENSRDEGALVPEIEAIRKMDAPPFERFIELITHIRYRHHVKYLHQMLDKLGQKNSEYGALVQGKSAANPRRWHLGSRLLEVFVQLGVLGEGFGHGRRRFQSRPLLIDDFVNNLEHRYGFVLSGSLDPRVPPTLSEHKAYRENIQALKAQLREIGFFDDLSDAFNAQTIRPRYSIDAEVPE